MSIQIHRLTGPTWNGNPTRIDSGGAGTTKANAVDQHLTTNTSPIKIPSEELSFSFWVTTTLYSDGLGSHGVVDNVRWYGNWNLDSMANSGIDYQVGILSGLDVNYSQAIAHPTKESSGADLYETYGGQPYFSNYYGYYADTSPSGIIASDPIDFGSMSFDASSEGYLNSALIYQVVVSGNASPGSNTTQTFTWQYDES